jgi:hypothetical protein
MKENTRRLYGPQSSAGNDPEVHDTFRHGRESVEGKRGADEAADNGPHNLVTVTLSAG